MAAPARGIGLLKSVKDVGQKIRGYSFAIIDDTDFHLWGGLLKDHLNGSAARSELDRVAQQVPKNLLQPSRITDDGSSDGIEHRLETNSAGLGGCTDSLDCFA
jgi:hypothetical protein